MPSRLAYLAGFFDADGTVAIAGRDNTFQVRIKVTQVSTAPLEFFCQEFGGKIYGPYKHDKGNGKPYYQWVVEGRDVFPVLRSIAPLLVVKYERVQMILESEDIFVFNLNQARSNAFIHGEVLQRRADTKTRLTTLNKRGV